MGISFSTLHIYVMLIFVKVAIMYLPNKVDEVPPS